MTLSSGTCIVARFRAALLEPGPEPHAHLLHHRRADDRAGRAAAGGAARFEAVEPHAGDAAGACAAWRSAGPGDVHHGGGTRRRAQRRGDHPPRAAHAGSRATSRARCCACRSSTPTASSAARAICRTGATQSRVPGIAERLARGAAGTSSAGRGRQALPDRHRPAHRRDAAREPAADPLRYEDEPAQPRPRRWRSARRWCSRARNDRARSGGRRARPASTCWSTKAARDCGSTSSRSRPGSMASRV